MNTNSITSIYRPSPSSTGGLTSQGNSFYKKISFLEHPFSNTADFRYLYFSDERRTLFDKIIRDAENRNGLIVIEGDKGLGKTTLAKRIVFKLSVSPNHYPLFIQMTNSLKPSEFWKHLLIHFDLPVTENIYKNQKSFIQYLRNNRDDVFFDLVIDDAEEMNDEMVALIQGVDSINHIGERVIQIFAFGTPKMPELEYSPFKKYHLKPFDVESVQKMIEFRLFVSGYPQLFSHTAMERIYALTQGNPLNIIKWCRKSLDSIIEKGKMFVDVKDIDEIMQVLGIPPIE